MESLDTVGAADDGDLDITTRAVMDFGTLELDDANDEPLLNGRGERCSITLYSPGSKEFAKAQNAVNNRMVERLKKKGGGNISEEEEARQTAERLAACTISFNNFKYPGEFTTPKAMHVAAYRDRSIGYIADQVNKYLGDWGNFTNASAKG